MDISGPIRSLLAPWVMAAPGETALQSPLLFLTRIVVNPAWSPAVLPEFPKDEPSSAKPPVSPPDSGLPARMAALLAQAALLRTIPRVHRGLRGNLQAALREQFPSRLQDAQKCLVLRSSAPVQCLWHYWLLALARKNLGAAVPEALLRGLWQRAFSAQKDGPLHPPGDGSMEAAVFQDLCALHAAYSGIVFTQDYDLFPPVQRLVDWHLAHTQPDHITTDPWALAAFAGLDASGSFAQQQLHDATTHLANSNAPPSPVTLALLADALITQEEAA